VAYVYPVAVQDLVARVKRRGPEVVKFVGLEEGMRDDLALTHIVWGMELGWFPVHQDGSWHGAVDIGLPDWSGETVGGVPVYAVGDGEVVYVDEQLISDEGYDFGRVIVRHAAPTGQQFHAHYEHLVDVRVFVGQRVTAGDTLGKIGSYGSFPHLSVAVAALEPLGGRDDLLPEAPQNALPSGEGAYNVLRVKMDALDPVEWPLSALQNVPGYLFNPIEVVRYCRGEPYMHDIGPGSRHDVVPTSSSEGHGVPANSDTEVRANPLRSKELQDDPALVKMAQTPGAAPIAKGHSNEKTVKAIQRALKVCQYNVGRFGPDHDGIDGDFGATTERILKDFQTKKLKALFDQDAGKQLLAKFGQTAANARTDGALDWLTLVGLDIYAAAHASAPPAQTPPVIPPTTPSQAPAPAAGEISLEDAKVILLKCTSVFEGAWNAGKSDFNYGVIAPNFDLAGMSIGIIQWNIKSRNVFPLLKKMLDANAAKFQECYEGGNADRFKPYFTLGWTDAYGKDVWKYSEFVKFMSTTNLTAHFIWTKLLHKATAIQTVTKEPKWQTKSGKNSSGQYYSSAAGGLEPELVDFFRRLGEVKEFQDIQRATAWDVYGSNAISEVKWLREACKQKFPALMEKIELRTLAAIFDLCVQQGSFGGAKAAIKNNIASKSYSSQKEILSMAVIERGKTAAEKWQNNCASRRLGFVNAQATESKDLGGDKATIGNCNYKLLKDNPHVQGL
jgi:peptidoglycan hydrolase-like protein with peptidoglycan-binding domain